MVLSREGAKALLELLRAIVAWDDDARADGKPAPRFRLVHVHTGRSAPSLLRAASQIGTDARPKKYAVFHI